MIPYEGTSSEYWCCCAVLPSQNTDLFSPAVRTRSYISPVTGLGPITCCPRSLPVENNTRYLVHTSRPTRVWTCTVQKQYIQVSIMNGTITDYEYCCCLRCRAILHLCGQAVAAAAVAEGSTLKAPRARECSRQLLCILACYALLYSYDNTRTCSYIGLTQQAIG